VAVTEVGTPTSGSSGSATATSFATSFPATPADGDWAVIFGHLSGNSLTMSMPAGWNPPTSWTNPFTQSTSSRVYAWVKQLTAGESAPTITNSGSVTGGWECHLYRDASGARGSRQGAAATSVTLPTLTGCTAGSKLLAVVHARVATGTIPSGITPDAAYAEALDHGTSRATTNANVRMATAGRDVATAGDYGGESFSVTNAISSSMAAGLVEILPAVTASEVTLTPAVLAVEAAAVTPVPQPVTVALTPAAAALAAVTLTATPQPVVVALSPAAAALVAVPVAAVPGPAAVTLTPAVFTVAAAAVAPAAQPVTVALAPATVAVAAAPVGPAPGPVTVALAPAALAVTAVPVAGGGSAAVTLTPAPMTLTAVPAGVAPGAVTVQLAPAGVALAAVAVQPLPGPVGVALSAALLELAAVPVVLAGAGGTVPRPDTGVVARPGSGTVARPSTGTVARPAAGLVVRPDTGVIVRP
jgi:hypothetical protein